MKFLDPNDPDSTNPQMCIVTAVTTSPETSKSVHFRPSKQDTAGNLKKETVDVLQTHLTTSFANVRLASFESVLLYDYGGAKRLYPASLAKTPVLVAIVLTQLLNPEHSSVYRPFSAFEPAKLSPLALHHSSQDNNVNRDPLVGQLEEKTGVLDKTNQGHYKANERLEDKLREVDDIVNELRNSQVEDNKRITELENSQLKDKDLSSQSNNIKP
ncbi:hypothetical protein C8J55DRAFT_561423 [Lentinula edodes]|uniref:Uncharacterized protein n=1 Tax=Lentinula lateritia TaxID=40482 RepID=A0A9W9DN10_9AGAR|nr:hypothetical protein C8J55DRAFT_561423 [Lentinula edodes]